MADGSGKSSFFSADPSDHRAAGLDFFPEHWFVSAASAGMDLPVAGHVRMAEQLFVPPLLPAVYTGSAGGMSGAENET